VPKHGRQVTSAENGMNTFAEPADQDRPPETGARGAFRGGSFLVALVFSAGLFAGVLFSRGKFGEVFADFGYRELPATTNIARSLPFLLLAGTLLGVAIAKEWLLKDGALRSVWNDVTIIVALVLGGLYVIGMFIPLTTLAVKVSP
jgi:hypothetical protein